MRHTLCHLVLRLLTSQFQTLLTDLPADAAQLFNNASIYSFVVLQACAHHARNYIREVLGPVLTDLVHKSHLSFEIDHRYVGTDEVECNLSHLCHVANHIIAALLISVDSLPMYARPAKLINNSRSTLRRIYRFAQVCIEDTYPESAARIPGHLFFTRLVCEALLSPEEFGLVKGKMSDSAIRAHALLTKILRCVAEETAPSEEALRPLAQWMEKAITSVRRFFKLALVRLPLAYACAAHHLVAHAECGRWRYVRCSPRPIAVTCYPKSVSEAGSEGPDAVRPRQPSPVPVGACIASGRVSAARAAAAHSR